MTSPADGKEQEVSLFPPFIGDSLQARVGRDLSGVTAQWSGDGFSDLSRLILSGCFRCGEWQQLQPEAPGVHPPTLPTPDLTLPVGQRIAPAAGFQLYLPLSPNFLGRMWC